MPILQFLRYPNRSYMEMTALPRGSRIWAQTWVIAANLVDMAKKDIFSLNESL